MGWRKLVQHMAAVGILAGSFIFPMTTDAELGARTYQPEPTIEITSDILDTIAPLYMNEVPVIVLALGKEAESECKSLISESDLELLALVTMAEAEGECEEGKRLVIDTILNRVDHEKFPNDIRSVIYQKNQFTSMHNGRVNRVTATEEIKRLVLEEVENRTNYDVIFFTAGGYGKYGKHLFSVGNHYFSGY